MPSENPGVSEMIITFSIFTEVFLEWKDYSSSNTLYIIMKINPPQKIVC